MGNIILHPKLGVNPRLTFCPRCGGDGQELVMLGSRNYKDTCEKCGMVHYGGADKRTCQNPGCGGWSFKREELAPMEKLPGGLCDKCAQMQRECDEAVAAGGVYWKCEGCGSEGAVKAEAELAVKMRADHPEHDGQPLGVLIGECPICRPKDEQEVEP